MNQWDVNSGRSDDRGYPENQGTSWDGYPAADPYAAGHHAEGYDAEGRHVERHGETDPYAVDPEWSVGPAPYGPASGYPGNGYQDHPGTGIAGGPQHAGYAGGLYAPLPATSGSAVTGFILGMLSFLLCPGVLAPFGLVFSILGMRDTSPTRGTPRGGRGLAIAGLVLNILILTILLLMVLLFVIVVAVESA